MQTQFLPPAFYQFSLVSVIILIALTSLSEAQVANNQTRTCSSRFETDVVQDCFTASGINFTGVMYIISGNMSGTIPSEYTYSSFLQLLCSSSSQDEIIPCVLRQMNKYNASHQRQCSPADRNTLYERGGQLLAYMEVICGQPCEQVGMQSIVRCFAVAGLHPERILRHNTSISDDKYSIIGRNDTEVDNFCKNREKLFSCMRPLAATCPGLLSRMYAIGIDLQAMETSTEYLCNIKQKYLQSLICFNKPSTDIAKCTQNATSQIGAAFMDRYQTGSLAPSKYQEILCKTKLNQIGCELEAYRKICEADMTDLRTSVQCTLLPRPCRDSIQTESSSICQQIVTPLPVQTTRPTQDIPGVVPVNGSPSDVVSIHAGTCAVVHSDISMMLLLLLTSIAISSLI